MTCAFRVKIENRWSRIIGQGYEDKAIVRMQAGHDYGARILIARKAGATFQEIADFLGLSKERVRQIAKKAERVEGRRAPIERWRDEAVRSLVFG